MQLSRGHLVPAQKAIVEHSIDRKIFLSGPAGTGKTTVGVERLHFLLENGVPGKEILLLVPQRTLAAPYYDRLWGPSIPPGSVVTVLTIGGLARRMVDLFWPEIAEQAGFTRPDHPPIFLTLETAQYFMAHLVRPLLDQGFFDHVTIDRNRLYSQILDNLNKATVQGFPHTEIGERLKSSWVGDPGQVHIYEDTQVCASEFRSYCLKHNLLDFSLQLGIFANILWPQDIFQNYIQQLYHHLIFDNLEEDTPVTGDILSQWLPHFESTLLIYDQDAGYRRFLGAEPQVTEKLAEYCDEKLQLNLSFTASPAVTHLEIALANALKSKIEHIKSPEPLEPGGALGLVYPNPPIRLYPEMLDWVVDQAVALIDQGTPPGEIVILAPYLSDALRYALVDRFTRLDIPTRSHRPSRSLREEPATRCLLTLSKFAFPEWGFIPHFSDVIHTLMLAIDGLDLVRAQLLVQSVFYNGVLNPFEQINPIIQERISYLLGNRYDQLRQWLQSIKTVKLVEMDYFISQLFGEILSQPGFGFHTNYDAAGVAANLVESIQKFRRVAGPPLSSEGISLGQEYLQMVEDGVIASQYLLPWNVYSKDAVFLAPAYTFLLSNQPVDYQFWLDVGSHGWYERLYQPLTHPYVLSRQWPMGRPWTDIEENQVANQALFTLTTGLVRRCRQGVYLGLSELSESGFEAKGNLLKALDLALRSVIRE